jgi:hypothetical protein
MENASPQFKDKVSDTFSTTKMLGYFTLISDCDKVIIAVLQEEFPTNHHIHCMVHIASNVLQFYSMCGE